MTTNFFQAATMKKKSGRSYPKKSQVAPYKNLGSFYMVLFKSLLRVKIFFFHWPSIVNRDTIFLLIVNQILNIIKL